MRTHKGESSQMKPPGNDIHALEDETNIEKDSLPETQEIERQRVNGCDHTRPILQEKRRERSVTQMQSLKDV